MVGLYILIFILGVLVLIKAFPSRKRIEIRWLLMFTAIICFISFCSLNVYVQDTMQNKILFSRIRFLGFSLIGQTWFFFLFHTYGKRNFFHKPWIALVSLAPAIITWTVILVPQLNEFFTYNYQPFPWHDVSLVTFEKGPWFTVHLLWSHMFVWLGVFYTIYLIPRVGNVKRKQVVMLSIGGFVAIFVDLIGLTIFKEFHWAMLSSGTTFITEGAILYSISKHGLLDLSLLAKDQVFHGIPDPVLVLDMNRRLVDCNDSAKILLGLTTDDSYSSLDKLEVLDGLDFDKKTQEWKFWDKNIGRRYFQVTKEPLQSNNSLNGKILLFREITMQKEVEEKLSNHLEFKARLLSMIAHDFSGVIETQAYLSSAIEKGSSGVFKTHAKSLINSQFASRDFLSNILIWAKSQENQFKPQIRPFEVNVLIKEGINHLESVWKVQDIEIIIHSEKDPLIINGDDVMIESVVRNLLTNAIRASKGGQKIDIYVKENLLREVKILVKDYGIGMTQKQLEAVQISSEELFSCDPDTRRGFGLGLAITRRFVDLHKGRLEFISQEGNGSLVTLTLPA